MPDARYIVVEGALEKSSNTAERRTANEDSETEEEPELARVCTQENMLTQHAMSLPPVP